MKDGSAIKKLFRLFSANRKGQGTVENLMLTAVIAGLLIPVVVKYAIYPMIDTLNSKRQVLVDFVAQKDRKPVPNAWFASERLAQIKDAQKIDEPKDIKEPNEIGDAPPIESRDIKEPKEIKSQAIPPPKPVPPPKPIPDPKPPGSGAGGAGGAGGKGSALGSDAEDPDFFGGSGNKGDSIKSGEDSAGGANVRGGRGGEFDEYSPGRGQSGQGVYGKGGAGEGATKSKEDASLEKKSRQGLFLNEVREEEKARATPFDWWALIKILLLALIIFLVVLIALSNARKK